MLSVFKRSHEARKFHKERNVTLAHTVCFVFVPNGLRELCKSDNNSNPAKTFAPNTICPSRKPASSAKSQQTATMCHT